MKRSDEDFELLKSFAVQMSAQIVQYEVRYNYNRTIVAAFADVTLNIVFY